MTANDADLLGAFVRGTGTAAGQDAFTELVKRHLGLVYCAAMRQLRSPHLAEDVSQQVFIQLARCAASLERGTILTAWLYQVTRRASIDLIRRESRRQAREQVASEMMLMNDPGADWTQIEPLLEEAMQSLDETDRTAILLRFFENKSLREVGERLGASDDAAQKRVSRALDRLRDYFLRKKIAASAAGLAGAMSANAVQAAPASLYHSVAAASISAATVSVTASAAMPVVKTILMTTLQKFAVGAVLIGAGVAIVLQSREVSRLRQQTQALQQQQDSQALLSRQVQDLRQERDQTSNALALVRAENATLKKRPTETLKLRNEVGKLRDEKNQLASTSAISKLTASPEARKMLRDQQKMGMGMIYKKFAEDVKLPEEQADKFNDLLADHIMQDVDHVTTALRDNLPADQMHQLFADERASLEQSISSLLGPDGLAQYQDYTKNLLSSLTAQQFANTLDGTQAEKDAKAAQLRQAIQQEAQSALSTAGLPSDFQLVPILNFANIASEQEATQNLNLLSGIYQRAAQQAGSFLSPDEVTKFQAFTTKAITQNTSLLTMNRTLMAPIGSK